MRFSAIALATMVFASLFATLASAQVVVLRPARVYSPVVTTYSPVVVQSGPVVTYSSPVVVQSGPVVTYSPVLAPRRVVTYSPVIAAPVVTYRPAPAAYVVRSPAVVVRPKVYVRGQPVRNVLRAVTP